LFHTVCSCHRSISIHVCTGSLLVLSAGVVGCCYRSSVIFPRSCLKLNIKRLPV
jgi:hypothetical protein